MTPPVRRPSAATCGAASALALAACARVEAQRPGLPPRHALLVTVAGLRADHTSALLYPRETTNFPADEVRRAAGVVPTLDELGASGVLFAQAFAGALDPGASLIDLHGLGAGGESLAERFARAGFATVAFTAQPLRPLPAQLAQGFQRFEAGERDQDVARAAVAFLADHDFGDGRGLFLWLHFAGPQFPFEPGTGPALSGQRDYASAFVDPSAAATADGGAAFREAWLRSGAAPLSLADQERIVGLYDGEVAQWNGTLFYLLDLWRYLGGPSAAWESTATVVAGTNGAALFDELEGGAYGPAGELADPGLWVPLVLCHPASLTGRRVLDEVVELSDLAPTLCEWFGLERRGLAGRSLLALTDSYVDKPFDHHPALARAPDGTSSLRYPDRRVTLGPAGGARAWPVERLAQQPAGREASAEETAAARRELALRLGPGGPPQ